MGDETRPNRILTVLCDIAPAFVTTSFAPGWLSGFVGDIGPDEEVVVAGLRGFSWHGLRCLRPVAPMVMVPRHRGERSPKCCAVVTKPLTATPPRSELDDQIVAAAR
jgi:hypothetical protein